MNKLIVMAITLTALFSHNVCEASCKTPPIGPTGSSPQGPAGPTGAAGPLDISFLSAVFSIDPTYDDTPILIYDETIDLPFPTLLVSNGITQSSLGGETFQVSSSGYYLVEYTLNMSDYYDYSGILEPFVTPSINLPIEGVMAFYLYRVGDLGPFEPAFINAMSFKDSDNLTVSGHIIVYLDANDQIRLQARNFNEGIFFERGFISIIQLHH